MGKSPRTSSVQRRAQKRTKYSRDRIRTYLQLKNYAQEVGEHQWGSG